MKTLASEKRMPIGKIVRNLLGSRFRPVGEAYRAIFVDMNKIVDRMIEFIPPDAHVLDIGGGDGYVVNLMLDRLPNIRVTMTDIAPEIGSFIDARHASRVTLHAATAFSSVVGDFDVITMADVVHHVARSQRTAFFESLAGVARGRVLIVKDIQPGHLRSFASLMSDLYITGDKDVSLISIDEMKAYLVSALGEVNMKAMIPDSPNYMIVTTPAI